MTIRALGRLAATVLLLGVTSCVVVEDDPGDAEGAGGASTGGAGAGGAGAGGSGAGGASVDVALVREWALEVALGSEFGGGDRVVRWMHPPTLSVVEGTPEGSALLDELIPQLNLLMPETPIQRIGDGDTSADIDVHFIELERFEEVGYAHGFGVVPGNLGYFYMFWDGAGALRESYVLLARDQLSGDELRHFTFEETTQALGLARDSAIFEDSIFYANGSDGGSALDLSALDRRLVRLLYTHGAPGDDAESLGAKFDAHFFE